MDEAAAPGGKWRETPGLRAAGGWLCVFRPQGLPPSELSIGPRSRGILGTCWEAGGRWGPNFRTPEWAACRLGRAEGKSPRPCGGPATGAARAPFPFPPSPGQDSRSQAAAA